MEVNLYELWRFAHVLLFVYWLGADLGVYYSAKYIADTSLSKQERGRFLELMLLLDMGPRTALVLVFPTGMQLSAMKDFVEVPAWCVWWTWLVSLAWLALVWVDHWLRAQTPLGVLLRKIDLGFRYLVIALMLGLGVASLYRNAPFLEGWLAWKVLLYGLVIASGVYLRTIIATWLRAFRLIDAGQIDEANEVIRIASRNGEWGAYFLWALVAIIAFLGVAGPA
jgi:hypothetical protein